MSKELWTPSETDFLSSSKGYMQYALGLSIVNNPWKMKSLLGVEEIDVSTLDRVYIHAQQTMLNGLKQVIRHTNRPELRSRMIAMEDTYDDALPFIFDAVEATYTRSRDRLDEINPDLHIVRPMPLDNRVTYGYICHSRIEKLPACELMDGFMIAQIFEHIEE